MGLALQLVKELRPLSTQAYSLRPTYEFKLENVKKVHDGTKFLSLLDPKIWELLPLEIKYPHSLEKVKMKNKSWISENFPYMLCIFLISLYALLFQHFFSTIAYHFVTNTLYYYGNDKDDNVFFYYSEGLSTIITFIINNDGTIKQHFAGWEYCNFVISIL